jgi:hypothetical protein
MTATKSRKNISSESYDSRAARLKKLSREAKSEGVRKIGGVFEFKKWLYRMLG